MRRLLLSFGSRFTLLCLMAAVATTVGCGGGGGGGGGGVTPTVSLGSVTLSGQVEFPGTVEVQVDGAPAVVSGTTWTFTTTQVTAIRRDDERRGHAARPSERGGSR
ncbi:MAG: hypothetical protein H0W72_01265 [Planctomycetes bacterium]|nr:hypothetical protein [Planctomycetota bacterium]